jgi:glyoxylase-like metal-dependent hydrolase (beta-lactamase superfamily II)
MTQPVYTDLPQQISCIDTCYQRRGLAACYLIQSAGEAAFIDTGTAYAVPMLLELLASKGLDPAQVRYVIPTHVHLDHAGGAGQLISQLPAAQLVVHPKGARHLIDPTKLIAGATAVYGETRFKALYGELLAIPSTRVLEAPDGLMLELGTRRLHCLDTPGHARHHLCLYDEQSHGIFTGDTCGLSYREFDTRQGAFILPTTTPVQFEPEAWHISLDRLQALAPDCLYLTHFGRLSQPSEVIAELRRGLDDFVRIAKQATALDRHRQIKTGLLNWTREKLASHGCCFSTEQIQQLLEMDLELNTQGLEVWLQREEAHTAP